MSAQDPDGRIYGLLVEFETAEQLIAAAERVRDAGYRRWDCHSPLPLHGMDDAMGIKGTRLSVLVLGGGLTGLGLALLMQWWMNAENYPIVIAGKPLFSLPANIPIVFELTVLLSAITAVLAMLVLNRLPEWSHPLLRHPRFHRATIDRFYLVIEARDPQFDLADTRSFLDSLDGSPVEAVEC
jgi:hypothetical protein